MRASAFHSDKAIRMPYQAAEHRPGMQNRSDGWQASRAKTPGKPPLSPSRPPKSVALAGLLRCSSSINLADKAARSAAHRWHQGSGSVLTQRSDFLLNEGFPESLSVIDPIVENAQLNFSENYLRKYLLRKARDPLSFRRTLPNFLVVLIDRVYFWCARGG